MEDIRVSMLTDRPFLACVCIIVQFLLLSFLLSLLLPLLVFGQSVDSSSSTGATDASTGSSSSAVLSYVEALSGRYPVDWSLVPSTQPALSIPDNEELGPCICDLTVGSCDVNCRCDTDW